MKSSHAPSGVSGKLGVLSFGMGFRVFVGGVTGVSLGGGTEIFVGNGTAVSVAGGSGVLLGGIGIDVAKSAGVELGTDNGVVPVSVAPMAGVQLGGMNGELVAIACEVAEGVTVGGNPAVLTGEE